MKILYFENTQENLTTSYMILFIFVY